MQVLTASALLVSFLVAPADRTSEARRLEYAALLDEYRRGDATALVRVAAWPHDELRAAASALEAGVAQGDPTADITKLRAAAVLHAEASFALDAAGALAEGAFQRALGRELLEATSRRPSAATHAEMPFECSWWLAVGYHFRAESDLIRMAYGEADRACGGRPEPWLAFGALSEFLFSFGEPRNADLDGWPSRAVTGVLPKRGQEGQGMLAISYYRRAARADPQLWEARLRLGRVLARTGRAKEANSELSAVLASCRDPQTRFLAHLFLGDILDTAGQPAEAVARYRKAVEIAPSAGSAVIALSHALFVAGDAGAARAALLPYLTRDAAQDVTDPWLSYSAGIPLDGFERALERLRAAVRVDP